jgi:hypothetical protein
MRAREILASLPSGEAAELPGFPAAATGALQLRLSSIDPRFSAVPLEFRNPAVLDPVTMQSEVASWSPTTVEITAVPPHPAIFSDAWA